MGEIMIYSIFGFLLGILIAAILYFYLLKQNDNNNHILIQNEGLIKEIAGLKKNVNLLESLKEEEKLQPHNFRLLIK